VPFSPLEQSVRDVRSIAIGAALILMIGTAGTGSASGERLLGGVLCCFVVPAQEEGSTENPPVLIRVEALELRFDSHYIPSIQVPKEARGLWAQ
jgi:hypothetical protein